MSLIYEKYQNKNMESKAYCKWYARTVTVSTVGLDELAEHMASHHTPFSKGVVKGILTDMVSCIRELVLDGRAVKIPDLAIFSVGIKSEGVDKPELFTTANIKSAYMRARATGKFTRSMITRDGHLREARQYIDPDPKKPETEII